MQLESGAARLGEGTECVSPVAHMFLTWRQLLRELRRLEAQKIELLDAIDAGWSSYFSNHEFVGSSQAVKTLSSQGDRWELMRRCRASFQDKDIPTAAGLADLRNVSLYRRLTNIEDRLTEARNAIAKIHQDINETSPRGPCDALWKLRHLAGVFLATDDSDSQYVAEILCDSISILNATLEALSMKL
jgi:hypothetical protein